MSAECRSFERWLDQGREAASEVGMLAHARLCARCAAALAAERELEQALAQPPVGVAPVAFTAGVLRRLATAPRPRRVPAPPAIGWWLRTPADPPAAMALTLAGLVWWLRVPLWAMAATGAARLEGFALGFAASGTIAQAVRTLAGPFAGPPATAGLVAGLAPVVLIASWALFHWSSRTMARVAASPRLVSGR